MEKHPRISSLLIGIALLSIGYPSPVSASGAPAILDREKVFAQRETCITVGSRGCEFRTIAEALAAVTPVRATVYVMDPVHTECGIVVRVRVSIRGFGIGETAIQGAGSKGTAADRVFLVEKGGSLSLSSLTVRYGKVNAVPRCGGGIYNLGECLVEDCVVRDNMATYGVGIISSGPLTIRRTAIVDNVSIPRPSAEEYKAIGCAGSGGGLRTETGCIALVEQCLIAGNTSRKSGGGVFVSCESKATIMNSTISGNSCVQYGGGVNIRGDLALVHCTITGNTPGKGGGGVFNQGMVEMTATIVAGNFGKQVAFGTNGSGIYGSGKFVVNERNLVADGSLEGAIAGDPMLVPLADNGGSTLTHAIAPLSKAVDAIPEGTVFAAVDQRNLPRPSASGRGDIGAYEVQQGGMP